jgi:amino acid adenylation domain-containing protein
MTMLAAFLVLMMRYSGQRDLVVGSPSANRSRSELGELIGLFINNLVLRVQVDEGLNFLELLKRVRETTLGGFEHPDAPFDLLVRELASERNTENAPLFQTMFSMQNFPLDALKLPGLTVTPMETVAAAARFDLSAEVYPYDGELRVYFEYNAELYDEATMWELLEGFERVLRAVMISPETLVEAVPILSAEARAERLACGNDTELDVAACPMVHEALERFARLTPEKIAVCAGNESLSYAELNARADVLAARLRRAGVGAGALVPVCLKRSVWLPVALLAMLKTGAAYVPLDPIYPRQRIAGILEDVAPAIVITECELLPLVEGYAAELLVLDEPVPDALEPDADCVTAASKNDPVLREALAYVIFTSGSTGKPKGVEITHSALVNFLEAMRRTPGFTSEDRILAVTTVSFDIAGLELFLPIYAGGEVAIAQAPGDLPALLADLDRYRPTVMQATPALWQMLVSAGWDGDAALTMLCGGEALTPQLAAELVTRGKALWNMYGPTETTIWSSALRIEDVDEASVPVGGPIANTTFYVLDGRRKPVPAGVAGELYIGGSGVARGYFRRPELTAERFLPSPFRGGERLYRTGDLVRQRRDGRLEFLGRSDFQVKLRGFRIELGEIEFALRQQPEVAECVVLLRADDGQRELVAYLVAKAGRMVVYDELRGRLRERLPEYMTPAAAVVLDAFPRLPNGKLDRSKLPAVQASRARVAEVSQSEAANATEAVILRVFRGLLQTDRIGLHQRFFDLGAHSLMLVKAHDALRRELYPGLRLVSFFQYPSVAALALHIDQSLERSLVRSGSLSGELAHAAES